MKSFDELIEAVEENNRINDAEWKDWGSALHIETTYETPLVGQYATVARLFLNALIRDNGDNLQVYKDAIHALEYGIWI